MADTPTVPAKPRRKPAAAAAKTRRAPAGSRRKTASRAAVLDTTTILSLGAAILAVGAGVAGFLARRQIAAWAMPGSAEHAAPDLALDLPRPGADARAPVDFRPNMDAPMSPAERAALRPAAGPAPTMIADAGSMNAQTGAAN